MNHHDHDELRELESLRPRHADALGSAGYDSLADLRRASHGDLTAVDGIGTRLATKLKREVGHEGADGTGARKFSDAELAELLELDALKRRHAAVLRRDGYESVADLGRADHGDLTDISGVGSRVAMKLKGEVGHEDGTADDTGGAGASDDGSSGQSVSAERPGMVTGSTGHDDNRASAAPETVPGRAERPLAYADLQKGERLGSGGNADVYRATASTDEGRVELAVKEPRIEGTVNTDAVERLLEEAETWQKLDSNDHIVDVVDYGSKPLPWIAMERMDGGHLGARAGELPLDQALWTAVATTRAVRHAHDRGVAHLDLKPENVLFRSVEGAWDVPKVADWGLSKRLLDHSRSVQGLTPNYAAPEQFDPDAFGAVDNVTDIYGLGAVLYELFTGRPPYEGTAFEVMRQVRTGQPTPPSEVAPVPPAVDEVVLTALATAKPTGTSTYSTCVTTCRRWPSRRHAAMAGWAGDRPRPDWYPDGGRPWPGHGGSQHGCRRVGRLTANQSSAGAGRGLDGMGSATPSK